MRLTSVLFPAHSACASKLLFALKRILAIPNGKIQWGNCHEKLAARLVLGVSGIGKRSRRSKYDSQRR
jgi:hypothetical protein